MLTRQEHLAKDNHERYKPRKQKAFYYWFNNPTISGSQLGRDFGVAESTGCEWIRGWRKDGHRPEIFK